MFERLRPRDHVATLRADPAVPASLLVATTVVVAVASVLPGTVAVAVGVGAVAALAVPWFLHLRDRHGVWRPVVTTWWGEGVVLVPGLGLLGLYLLDVGGPGGRADVPGAFGPAVVAFVLGVWTLYRATRWYVDGVVGDDRPLATWAARQSRRRVARNVVFTTTCAALGGLVGTAMITDASLLADAGPSVFGASVGGLAGGAFHARRRHSYAAFEAGLRVRDHRFLHREQVAGFDLTDSELVIRTDGWFGDRRLRRPDLDDVERIRAVLEYYEGTRPHPPERRERAPAGVEARPR